MQAQERSGVANDISVTLMSINEIAAAGEFCEYLCFCMDRTLLIS